MKKKNKKFDQMDCLVERSGLSPQEVGKYSPKKAEVSPSSVSYKTPQQVLPGMYVYADGLISAELIAGCQVKAVVGYVEGKTVYALCLRETRLPWSSDWLEAKATQNMADGQEATRKILEISRKKRQKAEAAQWCYGYAEDGVKQGEAFLPSFAEWKKLFANKAAINQSLQMLGVFILADCYWSSKESEDIYAWKMFLVNGCGWGRNVKDIRNDVRAMIKIKL